MVKWHVLLSHQPKDNQSKRKHHEQRNPSRNHDMQKGLPVCFGQFVLPLRLYLISNIWIPGRHINYDAIRSAEAASQKF